MLHTLEHVELPTYQPTYLPTFLPNCSPTVLLTCLPEAQMLNMLQVFNEVRLITPLIYFAYRER